MVSNQKLCLGFLTYTKLTLLQSVCRDGEGIQNVAPSSVLLIREGRICCARFGIHWERNDGLQFQTTPGNI